MPNVGRDEKGQRWKFGVRIGLSSKQKIVRWLKSSGPTKDDIFNRLRKPIKTAGAWWTPENAHNMLALIALRANNRWESYWDSMNKKTFWQLTALAQEKTDKKRS